MELPDVAKIERLALRPGDRLVLTVDHLLEDPEYAYLRDHVRAWGLPEGGVIILEGDQSLRVLEGQPASDQLPPLPSGATDQATARMCQETGHSCIACPSDVRNLAATAHNTRNAVKAALNGGGSWERALRKLGELESALETWQPAVDGHFAALEAWRRP